MNSHLERAIQKAMSELDKQTEKPNVAETTAAMTMTTAAVKSGKGNSSEKKSANHSPKSTKTRTIKIAPAPSKS